MSHDELHFSFVDQVFVKKKKKKIDSWEPFGFVFHNKATEKRVMFMSFHFAKYLVPTRWPFCTNLQYVL